MSLQPGSAWLNIGAQELYSVDESMIPTRFLGK